MENHETVASTALFYDFDHARTLILKKHPHEIARDAQVDYDDKNSCFTFLSLNQMIVVSYPECKAIFEATGKAPDLNWHMPILHYLSTANGIPLSGELTPIRSVDKYVGHPELFERETGGRLIKHFDGKSVETIKQVCTALGGETLDSSADLYVKLNFLPRFPVYIKLWMTEDELPGSGQMLFDKRCLNYLGEKDIQIFGPLIAKYLTQHYDLVNNSQP